MTPEEANARNQAMVSALEEQRNAYANENVKLKADLHVALLGLQGLQARIAELEVQVNALTPEDLKE